MSRTCSTPRSPSISPRSSTPPAPNKPSRMGGMPSPTRQARTSSSLHTSPALASSDNTVEGNPEVVTVDGQGLRTREPRRAMTSLGALRSDGAAPGLFFWPTVLFILTLSLFPLVASIALSLSRLTFRNGGVDLTWVGFTNYQALLFGLERSHFLGVLKTPNPLGWAIVIATIVLMVWAWTRSVRSGRVGPFGLVLRLFAGIGFVGFVWVLVQAVAWG